MTKTYKALVVEIDPYVEEAILLVVEGAAVRCFVSYSPSEIEVGKTYEVEFEMVLSDEECVSPAQCEKAQIKMLGSGFPCEIYGYLDGEVFRSLVDFTDQDIHYEFPHLNGQFVKINADRIDVSFVR
ncbi:MULTISPECIES: hypothetical protein [Pseudomonas]|uniref:Uncharacterized protein n=1 Tax=Pseudomonas fluorescens (strain Pf0-1) TaxID=205922 RepID=Q3KFG3_PSEPF|nr:MULTISPECIES: hypothetical protein [Pseudomonas]ABA73493.1 conserved hypothetical protein [Pseudomonas fluorescens Pf0-1]MBL0798939.1 hypothetical protein [Pseudomonas sp. B7]MBY9027638.1 hypothetical protein [Pseudomonas fluorescens]MBY9033507.1 hypothetical protein [Pseudomonas fluorescens]MBY9039359.1 hypothetical protein [Pseudomonas fluorescens]